MRVDEILDANKLYSLEGDNGVKSLNVVAKELGYDETGLRFGSSLELLLADNMGLVETMIEWIDDNLCDDDDDD